VGIKMLKIPISKWPRPPWAMTHGFKIWVEMKHKYYSTHIKQNNCMRQNISKPHNEKYDKVLNFGGFGPHPGEMT
jgi:hypothetical protein